MNAETWLKKAYPHQKAWFDDRQQPYRNILVDRHCGLTTAMAMEGYIQANETERLQVFIAPTVQQAEIFKHYIMQLLEISNVSVTHARFISPQVFLKPGGDGYYKDYDVYVTEYLFMRSQDLGDLMHQLTINKPVRQTWMSARAPDPKLRLLEQVTHKHQAGSDAH